MLQMIQPYAPATGQPDGLTHLVAWRTRSHSLCWQKLSPAEKRFVDTEKFGQARSDCPRCAQILRQKISTSARVEWTDPK